MENESAAALGRTVVRILWATALGWCFFGPVFFLLLLPYQHGAPLFLFLIIGVGAWILVYWKWRRSGTQFMKRAGRDIALIFLFATGGGAIGGAVAAFIGFDLYEYPWFTLGVVVVGFWILEYRERRTATALTTANVP
jgi:hypothetical protein